MNSIQESKVKKICKKLWMTYQVCKNSFFSAYYEGRSRRQTIKQMKGEVMKRKEEQHKAHQRIHRRSAMQQHKTHSKKKSWQQLIQRYTAL